MKYLNEENLLVHHKACSAGLQTLKSTPWEDHLLCNMLKIRAQKLY